MYITLPVIYFMCLHIYFRKKTTEWYFVFVYSAIAILSGNATFIGEGVANNALFDTVIAAALTVGMLARTLASFADCRGAAPNSILAITASLLFVPLTSGLSNLMPVAKHIWARHAERAEAVAMTNLLAAAPGPVACEELAWCFWANKTFSYDFFNMGQRAKLGGGEGDLFLRRVNDKYYAAVQIDSKRLDYYFGSSTYIETLEKNYRKLVDSPMQLWIPKLEQE